MSVELSAIIFPLLARSVAWICGLQILRTDTLVQVRLYRGTLPEVQFNSVELLLQAVKIARGGCAFVCNYMYRCSLKTWIASYITTVFRLHALVESINGVPTPRGQETMHKAHRTDTAEERNRPEGP